jgi:putative DNA primase/helicase
VPTNIDALLSRLHQAGGHLVRFATSNKPRKKNGWLVAHHDQGLPFVVNAGDWATGAEMKWVVADSKTWTLAEQKEVERKITAVKHAREQQQAKRWAATATNAMKCWASALPADAMHPYLMRKGIQPYHLRQQGDLLLVPLTDAEGTLWNLQRIHPDGKKRFMYGGRVNGCFALLGELAEGPLYVCEGLATGATIHQQSGHPTACAMNAGNLLAVCTALADPMRQLTVCADNDHQTDGNPGITKGREAAAAVGAALTWPEPCEPECICTDFNDLAHCPKAQGVAA